MKTYYRVDLYDDGKIELEKITKEECNTLENHCYWFSREKGRGISVISTSLKDCYKTLKSHITEQIKNKQNEIKEWKTLLSKIKAEEESRK